MATAFAGSRAEATIAARGGRARIVQTDTWDGAEALARLQQHNAEVSRVRRRIEKVFRACKRSYGLRRMRWLGLAKAGLQVRLTAIASIGAGVGDCYCRYRRDALGSCIKRGF